MIHNEADNRGVVVEKKPEPEKTVEVKTGLQGFVGTATQGFSD